MGIETIILQITATLLSPLIALRVNQELTDRKEKRKRRLEIFHTLMATRGSFGSMGRLAPEHVKALNMIDIEFHGEKRSKSILEAWKAYLDQLNNSVPPDSLGAFETWLSKRDDLLVDLLYAMSLSLGYKYDKTFIRRTVYSPQGFFEIEADGYAIRKHTLQILQGERPLQISVLPTPTTHYSPTRNIPEDLTLKKAQLASPDEETPSVQD